MVLGVYNQTIGIIVVIISVLAYFSVKQSLHYTNVYVNDENENKKILLISITSSQEHFEQRQAIRRTWVKLVNNEGLKHYFLIGKSFCMIPPQYRLSNLTCEEWKPVLDTNATDESLFSSFTKTSKCFGSEEVNACNSFSFILNHDIVLHQFGIKANILKTCNKPLRLILLDAIALKKIVSATFIQNNNDKNKDENEAVIWKRVTKAVLPSGFEGKLLLEGECNFEEDEEENEEKEKSFSLQLNDRTNIVRFLQVFNNNSSSVYVNNICTNVGFTFSIKNTNYLHKIITERDKEYLNWETNVKKISNKLNNEINTYRDILLLDIVDVYRNLPMKMFHFYQWLNDDKNNYTYVLKTDDDVFIDIPNILKELELKEKTEWNWWSCFRKNWPVQKAGKWRELHLNLTEYPTFPSGAGYVLHNNVIKYINKDTKKILLNLQGEDVALGVWLNDFKPNMHYGSFCQWSCNSQCNKGACNVMELSVSTMYELWERYLTCNNSLNCWCN